LKRAHVREVMSRAAEKRIAVPAFNIMYLPIMRPVVDTLRRLDTFGLVGPSLADVRYFQAKSFAAVAEVYRQEADPECVGLHLDHVPVIDENGETVDWESLLREGIGLGYESVMVDGSRLPPEENITVTRKVVEMAFPADVAVEAELGAVFGHEKGPMPPYEELFRTRRGFTDVAEARRFVKETGVDWLSVAVGSVHGALVGAAKDKDKVAARLHIEHLDALARATRVPLVLHGGTGIREESLREGIRHGIVKINIATDIRHVYERALAAGNAVEKAQQAVADRVEVLISRTFGVAGSRSALLG